MRATHAEASHRNGAEAVRLAERARAKSPTPEAVLYSTLAAAYAEAGRFPEAVSAGERAVELARAAHAAQDIERFAEQLRSYRAGKPFHFVK
jgi:Flp pilus assembly protein TadD